MATSGRSNKFRFQVHQDIFDGKDLLDEQNFYHQRYGKPDELSQKLTWLLGDSTRKFPLAMSTMGDVVTPNGFKKSNAKVKELKDIQFTYPVMSRLNKALVLASTNSGTSEGLDGKTFTLTFTDNWAKQNYMIESPLGVQAYILAPGEPSTTGVGYDYTLQLNAVSSKNVVPATEMVAGGLWSELNTFNAESESRGTAFKRVAPGKFKNQMSVIRLSHQWAGNAANKVMPIRISDGGGKNLELWMDFEHYQFERAWLEECEHMFWYSRYNRKANGTIDLKDILTGKVIPTGSGILEQVNNYSTYSSLTYNYLQNTVANALFGQSDTDGMSITLHTGRGGIREFDAAMKEAGVTNLVITAGGNIADKFVGGSNYNLVSMGFFDAMYHIDGYYIKVKHNAIFDYGRRAIKSPLHPETGYPLESYRMVFIDDGMYDGEANLQMVAEQGRRFLHGVVPGMAGLPRQYKILQGINSGTSISGANLALLATDVDKSSYHRLMVGGCQLRRGNTSLHLECIAGLTA
jgi:hypothetical protein